MKERPIPFSGPMVRAILDGHKTQTRRAIKPQPYCPTPEGDYYPDAYAKTHYWCFWGKRGTDVHNKCAVPLFRCPYGQSGDRLWVRETSRCAAKSEQPPLNKGRMDVDYKAGGMRSFTYTLDAPHRMYPKISHNLEGRMLWQPSIHMPRWASRILLEITNVRVERLQDISEADARAEGVEDLSGGVFGVLGSKAMSGTTAKDCFARLWSSINGPDSWAANPWVWVVEFKRLENGENDETR